ncbi:MAG TPA: carboxymuconolactone decarboxylase family protein [Pseudonocardiaceae bacterium]|jgi:AhpD family alkylhydroperoxidase|nr:carboxymuconolactone decarboxylase family protein [Pseudonocardiaceae bacterium]
MSAHFVQHTLDSAPPAARRFMTATAERLGYLPAGIGLLAESPHLLEGFLKLSALFEATNLAKVEREVVIMTMARHNECHLCVAMHTAKLTHLDADPDLIAALRAGTPLADPHLDALRVFVLDVLATSGAPVGLTEFLAAGYTERNALEVVLGIGTYTMSTFANRLTGAPVDEQLAAFAA